MILRHCEQRSILIAAKVHLNSTLEVSNFLFIVYIVSVVFDVSLCHQASSPNFGAMEVTNWPRHEQEL